VVASYGDPVDPQNVSADTIFVQVAAFRDPEYLPTLHSMFSRAANPGSIRVGACLQYDWQADKDWLSQGNPSGLNIDEIRVDAVDSQGVCWARNKTQELYQGERFTLQIDSHMRFVQGWDEKLVDMWRSLKNRKAIISHYAPNYEPSGGRLRGSFSGMGAFNWKKGTLWFHHAPIYSTAEPPSKPPIAAFVSGHFLFGVGQLIQDVRYDPYLERHGEESSLGVRLWTSGYDLFSPNEVIMWHRASQARPMDYQVIPEYAKRVELSSLRCQALLNRLEVDDPEVLVDLDQYGLGSQRSLQEYEAWSGVNFKEQTFSKAAHQGQFKPFKRKSAN
jgi:hypothetical protein